MDPPTLSELIHELDEVSHEIVHSLHNESPPVVENMASTPSPDGTSFLLKLPTELIGEIFKACHLSDHFNLALTCRRMANGGKLTLARHKSAARDYGVVTDWHHLTIPAVLNKAIFDPYVRYNIRRIEIYGTRYDWEHWGEFRAQPPPTVEISPTPPAEEVLSPTFESGDVWHDFRWRQVFDRPSWQEIWGPAHQQIGAEFDEDAMTYAMLRVKRAKDCRPSVIYQHYHFYIALMALLKWFSSNGHSDERMIEQGIDWAAELLTAGNDSLLKALLICLCPRLNILRHASCKVADENAQNIDVMDWLARVITMGWRQNTWAPGLKSLREVSIGVPTGLWFEDRNLSGFHEEHVVRSIMLLPGLKTVYFGTISLNGTPPSNAEQIPPQFADLFGCSSVENIYVDQFIDVFQREDNCYTAKNVLEFLMVPKKLKSLTIRGGIQAQVVDDKIDDQAPFTSQLMAEINDMLLYNCMLVLREHLISLIEYNCRLRPAEPTWNWFSNEDEVRQLWQGRVQFITISARNLLRIPPGPGLPEVPHIPSKAEVILIQKSYKDDESLGEDRMELLEGRMVIEVLKNGGFLKAIYIEQQPHPDSGMIDGYEYATLIDIGKEYGVDIHVKGNKNAPRHQIEFPQPPPMSKAVGKVEEGAVFDPFMGRWTKDE